MVSGRRFADPDADTGDDDAALLRPAWDDLPDETDADRPGVLRRPAPLSAPNAAAAWAAEDLPDWLRPLCDATDALARLDAGAAAAPDAVRAGLIARMAVTEAAGWLAHSHAWVHPLDLALRDLGLTGPTALAAAGSGPRALPHTYAAARPAWDDQTIDAIADGDRSVADGLALARRLRQLAGRRADPFATVATAETTLAPFGAGPLDPGRFARWQAAVTPTPPVSRRRFGRAGEGASLRRPSLLCAAHAAQAWMDGGIVGVPTPLQAVLVAIGPLAHAGVARTVFAPVWAAYPAAGFGDRAALPRLRSDTADRVVGWGRPVTWPVAFLHLLAESARMGLRELERLTGASEQGRGLIARGDKRSRLPDAIDALLRTPALTPKALAAQLRITPQTGTALLREMQAKGFVREVTGRGSFRAFAI